MKNKIDLASLLETYYPGAVLQLEPGEYEGSFLIDKPVTLCGCGEDTTCWSTTGPVLQLISGPIVIKDMTIEVTHDLERTAIIIQPECQVTFDNVRIRGKVDGLPPEQSFDIPTVIDIGALRANRRGIKYIYLNVPDQSSLSCNCAGILVQKIRRIGNYTLLKITISEDILKPGLLFDGQIEINCIGIISVVRIFGYVIENDQLESDQAATNKRQALGIDFGEVNLVMATISRGELLVIHNRDSLNQTPCYVGRGRKGELLIGQVAKNHAFSNPEETVFQIRNLLGRYFSDPLIQRIRRLVSYSITAGDHDAVNIRLGPYLYTPVELTALILRSMKEDAESYGMTFSDAVITVPAYFSEQQIHAIREAGRLAGFYVLNILSEPIAIVLAFGRLEYSSDHTKMYLVYQMNRKGFDVSIVSVTGDSTAVIGMEGDSSIGGEYFEDTIYEYLSKRIKQEYLSAAFDRRVMQTIRSKSHEVFMNLLLNENYSLQLPSVFSCEEENNDIYWDLNRNQVEDLLLPDVNRTIQLIDKLLREMNLSFEDIDQVLLTGSDVCLPLIHSKLALKFGMDKIRNDVNPVGCRAIGAVIHSFGITSIACRECNQINSIYSEYCNHCGLPLTMKQLQICPKCFTFLYPEEIICPRCQ